MPDLTMQSESRAECERMHREAVIAAISVGTMIEISYDGGRTWQKPMPVSEVRYRGLSRRGVPYIGFDLADVYNLRDGAVWAWLGTGYTADDLDIGFRVCGEWDWSQIGEERDKQWVLAA